MHHLTAVIAALLRAVFPPPAGRHHTAASEHAPAHSAVGSADAPRARAGKAHRIRPYAPATTFLDWEPIPADAHDAPAMVRPFLVAAERRREMERAEADRRGVAALAAMGGAR
ncbi:hypothetical protein GCM10023224_40820 [Streptomonospora halophila]|uniref:Uncharacterized protein n=1 Tax=Streptomonospora halophila TaxID=427369 RepID=A0ABP9GSN7_9ACTN